MCVSARCEIYFLWSLPFILHPSQRPEPPADLRLSNALSAPNPGSHDQISFIINLQDICGDRGFTHHFGPPPRAVPGKAQTRASWCSDGLCGEVWFRLGASLELCRLQLLTLDFQLHPPHRLRGRGKNNPSGYSLSPQS